MEDEVPAFYMYSSIDGAACQGCGDVSFTPWDEAWLYVFDDWLCPNCHGPVDERDIEDGDEFDDEADGDFDD